MCVEICVVLGKCAALQRHGHVALDLSSPSLGETRSVNGNFGVIFRVIFLPATKKLLTQKLPRETSPKLAAFGRGFCP